MGVALVDRRQVLQPGGTMSLKTPLPLVEAGPIQPSSAVAPAPASTVSSRNDQQGCAQDEPDAILFLESAYRITGVDSVRVC